MLEEEATLNLNQTDVMVAVEFWLNRVVLKDRCSVTGLGVEVEGMGYYSGEIIKTYKVSFITPREDENVETEQPDQNPDKPDPG